MLLKHKPTARPLSFTLGDVQTLVVSVEITQHAPTHSSPTMPSCYRVTCPPKRPSSGSSSDIPNTRTRALIQLIFGSCCTAHFVSDTWEGKLDQTKIIKREQACFFLRSTHHVPWLSSEYNLSILMVKTCRTDELSTSDRNLQR